MFFKINSIINVHVSLYPESLSAFFTVTDFSRPKSWLEPKVLKAEGP